VRESVITDTCPTCGHKRTDRCFDSADCTIMGEDCKACWESFQMVCGKCRTPMTRTHRFVYGGVLIVKAEKRVRQAGRQ
jgi:hypothetical protein